MQDEENETVEVTVKVVVEGEPVRWLVVGNEGFDLTEVQADGTRFSSIERAFDYVEDLDSEWPDATLSVIEEGWSGDWSGGPSPLEAAFWRR